MTVKSMIQLSLLNTEPDVVEIKQEHAKTTRQV